MKVAYLGPLKDYSGYGEANRHFVAALDAAGVYVIPQLVSYSSENSDFGTLGKRLDPLYARSAETDYKVKILHTTPNAYKKHMEKGKYHIGHLFWETDKLPEEFIDGLKLMDEIWTGSKDNEKAIRKSGLKQKVVIIPQAIEIDRDYGKPYKIHDFNGFLFYSIFEWIDRKDPEKLLNAYWQEFQNGENVGLLIKTYFSNFSFANKEMIRRTIQRYKDKSGLDKFPPVFIYLELMDRDHIGRLHKTGDVFVSAHRGEGWGVPQVEACLAGNPIISTGYGGCHQYFDDGKNAIIIPYDMVPVSGMDHSQRWYSNDQNWADANFDKLKSSMRALYEDRKLSKKIGKAGQKNVINKFNFTSVGKLMANRLREIEASL